MSVDKKMGFSFGFSKTKQKNSIVQAQAFTDDKKNDLSEKIDLITSIDSKKITFRDEKLNEPKKAVVIPCAKNESLVEKAKRDRENSTVVELEKKLEKCEQNGDIEAVKALLEAIKEKKEVKDDENLKIPIHSEEMEKNLEKIEEPNYEAIDLEMFGKAALRGMGWSEKTGIGLTNKRSFQVVEPELRPRGLGLGAGFGKKQKKNDAEFNQKSKLVYRKGAYVEILSGKYDGEFGEIIGFDDGLNRILVKLFNYNENISLLQNLTKLISKSEYESVRKRKR